MKMKSIACFLLVTIITIQGLYAQDNLKEGYILTLKGDTVHGFINVRDWGMNPEKVHFKLNAADEGTIYGPYDIKEFGMSGEVYEGGFIDVEVSSREEINLNYTADLILEKNLVFLQTLIKGPKSLYVYGRAVYDQFYIKTDSAFELLAYKKYLKDVRSADQLQTNSYVVENKRYQGQLLIYFQDCDKIKVKLKGTRYNQKDLEKLFADYYACTGNDFKTIKTQRNISFKFGITAGINLSSLDFNYFRSLPIEPAHFKAYPFGISLEIGRPVSLPRWTIYNDFSLVSPYSSDLLKGYTESSGQKWSESSHFNFYGWKMVNMLRYAVPIKKQKLFANIGLSNESIRGGWYTTTKTTMVGTVIQHQDYGSPRYSVMKLALGVGIRYSRLSFEVRFEPAILNKYAGAATNFLLNFRLNK